MYGCHTQNDLGEKVWRLLLKGFDDYKPTVSFKMISILSAYIIRTNPKIKRGLQLTYKYVFLDEFQDTTGLQYGLVKQCFLNSKSIMTAVGDNKQRIMVWAGALKAVFDDYKREFNAETQKLIMNHRSAPRLVDLQRKMYASLHEEDSAICVSDKWKPEDGIITLFVAKDDEQEATAVSEQIASKIKSGLEPNKICILCKQKPASYTERIISELKKLQIYARVEDDYQNLIKESIVEMLISILRLAVDIKHPHDWEYVVLKTSELWNIVSYQSDEDYLEMQDALDVEMQLLGSMMKNVASKSEFQEVLRHAIEFWGENRIKANFPVYGQGTYLKEVLTKFRDYMWNELESTGKDWLLAIEKFEGLHSVPIMTIHKSKGLEYDAVYFVGLEDSAFWSFKNQSEEDRCAFFVALSRAKKEIFFTFCQYRYTSRFQ
jgi:superfamily I DNA/RNA helicase